LCPEYPNPKGILTHLENEEITRQHWRFKYKMKDYLMLLESPNPTKIYLIYGIALMIPEKYCKCGHK
jgi:hypothetical protein